MSRVLNKSYIIGVGSTKFEKPRGERDYDELGLEAAVKALLDAGITYDDVEYAACGYVFGDSTCGQRVLYHLGLTGIPIVNLNNACSAGSAAFVNAVNTVRGGQAECAIAVGFEKMAPGSLSTPWTDRIFPMAGTLAQLWEIEEQNGYAEPENGPYAAQIFGAAGREYCERYGARPEHLAAIAAKNHSHSARNPYAQFRVPLSTAEVLGSRRVARDVTLPMCSPTSDGGAAAVVASEAFVRKHCLQDRAVEIAAVAVASDSSLLYNARSRIELAGADMTRRAARAAFAAAGLTPADIQVMELHDCFAANELISYDALGLCPPGNAHKIVEAGDNTYGGKWVINPSGGLESKGHPLGATGLGMIFSAVLQVRGEAGRLQAPGVRNALTHNVGLRGACVVSILQRPSFWKPGSTAATRFGYNVADEVRQISASDLAKVRSQQHYSDFISPPLGGAGWTGTGLGTDVPSPRARL
ncbi:putative sterol carrier protein [Cutaneotrichosporon oleaginosum]|uniref:Putative sterol carrier protein n=1 Tax=Cutaneotrichosporon oleaginosum TaxID=879819 RepID=A0A0J0XYL1_9TREE|nr:putative sterol carrier protein [Cutaneotrichosporon oleaginosum]KLT46138.1 putative sterol carrier protein [Cutaneotrichosporon oleaginosum]TXT10148.1 hypothetical protein COLE_04082 [Cutaneotrichosporon oleaginosum]